MLYEDDARIIIQTMETHFNIILKNTKYKFIEKKTTVAMINSLK